MGLAPAQVQGAPPNQVLSTNSRELWRNLKETGSTPAPGDHAHHLAASGDKRAERARQVLAQAGIGINDAINGLFLSARQHARMHTNAYYREVNNRLAGLTNPNAVANALRQIGRDILAGRFP